MTACQLYRGVLAPTAVVAIVLGCPSFAQQAADPAAVNAPDPAAPIVRAPDKTQEKVDHRILGVLPNYRTANPLDVYQPITTKQKFTIAMKDSFDWPNFMVSGVFAGLYQLQNQNPSFGQGIKGYAHRYWTSYIDQSMGNLMTEAVMPTLLHEDPRYFRKVTGSTKNRLGYALTRVLITKTDAGGTRFNFSEVIGNGVMASLGNAYYPANRGFSDTMKRLGLQVATDSFSNVLKEFWPDVKRRFFEKHIVE
jgi:hypothetical protein